MISRAALRALNIRPALAVPRRAPVASTSQWIRLYANNNRPPNNSGRDQTWKRSNQIKFDQSNRSRSSPVNPSEQPEFDTAAAPERNTKPSAGAGPDAAEAGQPNVQKEFSKDQEEFASPHSANENIDPTTESPRKPQKPLPDLRQGIPSTFGEEFGAEGSKAKEHDPNNITDDPDKEPSLGGAGGREGGELPKSAYETSTDRRRNAVAYWSYISTLVLGTVGAVYFGRNWDTEEEERAHPDAPSGWGLGLMYNRARARLNSQMGYYTEPTFPKLLPTIEPAPPMTLVLSLEDLLIHSEWSTKHGWRTAKRPGVDYFLRYLSQYYELVIFTSLRMSDADPVIRKLDPFRIVMWPLFREATRYEKGEYIKDLSCLNRDLSKTIIIDTDPAHVKLQPENAIVLPKWKGDPKDKDLVALIPFLEYLAMMGTQDVREAIKSFEGKDIAKEFAIREARAREEFNKELAKRKSNKPRYSVGSGVMGALGLRGQQGGLSLGEGQTIAEGFEQGKMLSDQFRERGQKAYEELEKQIRENGEKWLKEMAEEEKKLMDQQMKEMKTGMFSWLGSSSGSQK